MVFVLLHHRPGTLQRGMYNLLHRIINDIFLHWPKRLLNAILPVQLIPQMTNLIRLHASLTDHV